MLNPENLSFEQNLRAWAFTQCQISGNLGGWRFGEMISAAAELVNYVTNGVVPEEAGASSEASSEKSGLDDHSHLPEPSQSAQEFSAASPDPSYSSPVSGLDAETVAEPEAGAMPASGEG